MRNFFRKSKNSVRFLVLAFFIFIFFSNFQTARAVTFVSGEILFDTIWTKEGSPYVVEDYLEVGEDVTLTIDPGVIVKLNQSYIDVYGKIIALGSTQEKIYLTSFLDDSVGGDTNNDGTATSPDDGDWQGINFYKTSSGSEFEYLDSKYAETNFYLDSSDLTLSNSSVSLVGYIVIDSRDSDVSIMNNIFDSNYYVIETLRGSMTLRDNVFTKNYMPVYADYETVLENGGNSMSGNAYNGIGIYGDLYYVELNKIFHKDLPYILFDDLSINRNSTIVIDPGVVIKTDYDINVNVYGTLKAVGTEEEPIVITSIADDFYGGDTNGDGEESLPDPWGWGDWEDVYFGQFSSASELKNVTVKYGDDIYLDSVDLIDLYKINIENNIGAFYIYNGNVKLENSTLKNNNDGIIIYKGSLDLRNSSVLNTRNSGGINAWQAREINIAGNTIGGNDWNGIYLDSASTTITGNFILGNYWSGVYVATSAPATISGNDIYGNSDFGIYNWVGGEVIAKNNWWGDSSGPYHPTLNPEGKGDEVSDGVIFDPWLKASIEKPVGFSSVAFIPGIQASRLYKEGSLFENQLWEPNRNNDVRKLFMNVSGKSIDGSIYTRDIIRETNSPFSTGSLGLNIYKKFSESMDRLVASSTISAWKALAYDWRFDLSDIVDGGVERAGGNISFINQKPEGQMPYMILELEKLAENSKNGKVTIITHSNGGLVAKALLKKLAEMKESSESDLIDKIDRLIMVAAPELGTPQAITSMLHGDGQELGFGWILREDVARGLAENMLGAYNLLPSEKYFNTVLDPMIKFDSSLDKLNSWRTTYGDEISSYSELQDFILGKEGRAKPSSGNTDIPNVLSASLRSVAENNHRALDDWQIPTSIEVTQIAGWGLDTVSGVGYFSRIDCAPVPNQCIPVDVLDREPIFTSEGDQTVVIPSATTINTKTYYLDLYKHNKFLEFNIDREHKDIMEIMSVQILIDKIIKDEATSTLPTYITLTKPESENKKLRLSVHSPVSIDIYDNLGNHTGLIPNPDPNSDLELVEDNIPNSYYMNFGEGKYVGFSSGSQNKVELNGTGSGTFTLKVGEYLSDTEATSTAFVDIPVTSAMKGELNIENLDTLPQLKIDVEGDGIFDFEIKPSDEFDPILFLEIMKKTITSFDLKKNVEKNLVNRIDNLIKSIKKGKIKQADKKIKGFIKKFESKNKHDKKIDDEEKQAILDMLNQLLNNF